MSRLILSDRDRETIAEVLEREANRVASVRLRDLATAIRVAEDVAGEEPDEETVEDFSDALYTFFEDRWRDVAKSVLDSVGKRRATRR